MQVKKLWMGLTACFEPDNGSNGAGVPASAPAPGPAPSTSPAPAAAPEPRPIDHATQQMLADDFDLPPDYSQDSWDRPDPVRTQTPAAQPTYPQPVTPGQKPVQPLQQPQTQPQTQPPQPVDPNAAIQERVRRDPFGMQADILQQQEAQYVDALAKTVYPVSQEDLDAFLSGDGTRISSALARVHVNAVGSVLRVVSQQMPVWINNMMQLHTTARDRETEFWHRNSFLDRQKHGKMALTAARAYRQMNPQAADEEIDRMVGAMVAATVGIAVPAAGNGTANAQPGAPTMRTPGPVVRQAPQAFSPAGTSAPGLPRRAPAGNQWSEFAEILMADQAGRLDNVT